MNLAELQQKLIAAARANPPSDRVPLAFEKRIMALITARPLVDRWAAWSRALWFAAAPCVAIMLLFGTRAFLAHTPEHTTPSMTSVDLSLSQQFDSAMLAVVDQQVNQEPEITR